MASPSNLNKPTDLKAREADVNRKLQFYGIASAFQNGKLPSNDQIDVALNSLLESRALSRPSKKLSAEGQELVQEFREVIRQAKNLILSKNQGNLIQDFVWQTMQFDPKSVNTPDTPVDKDTARRHADQTLEGLRTLGTLLITNGQFRKLLNDATVLIRDMAGDAATNVATRARPSEEQLAQIDRPAEDNVWHDAPDFSKENFKKQAQSAIKSNKPQGQQGTSTTSDSSTVVPPQAPDQLRAIDEKLDPQTKQKAQEAKETAQETKEAARQKAQEQRARLKEYLNKKVPQERREQTVWRLKKMIVECQGHPDYQSAISTLLDLAEQYGEHARRMATEGSGVVKETRSGLAEAEVDLRTLIERFANGTSTHDLWDSINAIYKDADRDPELKDWFKALNRYIRRCLQEQGYIIDEASNQEWNRLYDHGNYLLRDKYRGHTNRVADEIRFLAEQFDQDPQNRAFADTVTQFFNHLGNDENGKPTFKPHLVKDLTDVIIPAALANTTYIPLPRIEYTDPQVDVVIDNLVLESDNFMPNLFDVASENYFRWGRKAAARKNKHTAEVHLAGVQLHLPDVSYYVKRKSGFPTLTDTGVANILLAGEGLTAKLKLSSADGADRQHFLKLDKAEVDLRNLKMKLVKSKHKLLFNMFSPLMLKVFRPALKKAAEKALREQVDRLDGVLYQIKQEADRLQREAKEDPANAPNIYRRYAEAARNRAMRTKEQAQQKAAEKAADKKANAALTKEDSIFPQIKLPGEISAKATEYKELARKGDRWESPVFSIGSAARSRDVPPPPEIKRKPHQVSSPQQNGAGARDGSGYGSGYGGATGAVGGNTLGGSAAGYGQQTTEVNPSTINPAGVPVGNSVGGPSLTAY